ncbi:MAG: hypothetical protein FWG53_06160 [Clostridiales bacterium]|nr:hypothetical protein [Clostridiales bacterium]
MQNKDLVLGIDTSNYKTSVAVVSSSGETVLDLREPLAVKAGERGLRQSHALFQHLEALPRLIGEAVAGKGGRFVAVSVSTRPRPVDSSYMPVFKAGENIATVFSHALGIPIFRFSHQEGHIEAVKNSSSFKEKAKFLCYHLSGGTSELLAVDGGAIKIIGGTKDISFGQAIDRTGVLLGMPFPCGGAFDEISIRADGCSSFLKAIPVDGLFINLSGIETQAARVIGSGLLDGQKDMLVKEVISKIAAALVRLTENAVAETGIKDVLFAGGVSSSKYLHGALHDCFDGTEVAVDFGDQALSSDNAVGMAVLGVKQLWR